MLGLRSFIPLKVVGFVKKIYTYNKKHNNLPSFPQ